MEVPQITREHQRSAKAMRQSLIGNPMLYLESVGKTDHINIVPDPQAEKRGNAILRLILGATEEMPFRALSYIDSAVRSAEELGVDQLQIIHANAVGNRINGINKFKSDEAAARLADAAGEVIGSLNTSSISILHALDTPFDTERHEPLARAALENNPSVADKLMQRGAKHGGDALAYTAVHFAFQDTNDLELQPISPEAPPQLIGERVISIGCGQERTFYLARMAMRGLAEDDDHMVDRTAQLFTKHVSPPYYFARGGEPSLAEDIDPNQLDSIGDTAARRDIEHFITVNSIKETVHA